MDKADGTTGRVVQISVSDGGVPKLGVERARVTRNGVAGDRQNETEFHGGPERAVCVFSKELIDRLRAEGHPIEPGTTGENLTVDGLEWSRVRPGARLMLVGGVILEVVSYASPCKTIAESFIGGECARISQKVHAGESRVYCRVLEEGDIAQGEELRLGAPA